MSPTFADSDPRLQVEAHLPTYRGEAFYNKVVSIAFLNRLRNELKFDSLESLKSQIGQDVARTRAYCSTHAKAIETQLALLAFAQDA